MHDLTLNALEFGKIREQLASYASCGLGKELALNLAPLGSLSQIQKAQVETTEARAIVRKGVQIPFGGIQDVRPYLRRVETGGVLRPGELVALADTLYGCRQLKGFLVEQAELAPQIALYAAHFGRFERLEEEILRCIEHGTVSDRASRELKQVRREIAVIEGRIQEKLQSLLRQAGLRPHLQEAIVTQRDGRWVIPVRASSRSAVPGIARGSSASGATLFIEPEAVRALAEEMEQWRAVEEAEIEKVLIGLSGLVGQELEGLASTLEAVADLDLIFAKGRLSYAWDAGPVRWNDDGLVDLAGARHPLLGKEAVSNRIRLTAERRMLVITGPNTGGKTLLLKTLGMLVILAHCGLHIPVEEGSTLCPFREVSADIGDSQSLEQSLSTFSGHVANVAPMLAGAGPRSLILLDELGSGTDPHEGTALGIAVLEAFLARRAYVLATTHLREIKEFARVTPACLVAGMGFDGETLKPTYRLIEGAVGESHGLVIAARAGMPAAVVERAHALLHSSAARDYRAVAEAGQAERVARGHRTAVVRELPEAAQVGDQRGQRLAPPVLRRDRQSPAPEPSGMALVVASPLPGRVKVWLAGQEMELPVKGSLKRKLKGSLVVGDRVQVVDEQVVDLARRETTLSRRAAGKGGEQVLAANLTRLLIVLSARQPDFRPAILDRHLVYAEQHGITPVIVLTKADLVQPQVWREWMQPYEAMGYKVVVTSAQGGYGVDRLRGLIQDQVAAVIGHSGVGKSTLLSALTGRELKTGNVRQRGMQSGRHTTTSSEAIRVDGSTWVVDTPGLRELGFWNLTLPDLARAFKEFRPYAGLCRFANCSHLREPGCGVRLAVEQGQVDRRRYEHYQKLLRELHY